MGKNKKYKIKVLKDNTIYVRKIVKTLLSELYYLISYKNYLKDKNT